MDESMSREQEETSKDLSIQESANTEEINANEEDISVNAEELNVNTQNINDNKKEISVNTEEINANNDSKEEISYSKEDLFEDRQQTTNESVTKRKPVGRFIAGILTLSIVGGGAMGTSLAFFAPYAKAYYESQHPGSVAESILEANGNGIVGRNNVLPADLDNSIATIAKQVGPAIVSIYNNKKITDDMYYYYFYGDGSDEMLTGFGSGIIFSEDQKKYYIVTNSHVVEGADSLAVNFLGDIKTEAKLIGKDPINDVAVISVEKSKLSEEQRSSIGIAKFGDSDKLGVGQLAVAIGTPMQAALNNTVTSGIISGLQRQIKLTDKTMNLIQTDAAINPGNSGGALVGPSGEVIGINVAKATTGEGIGFAIPINTVKPIIKELIEKGSIIRPGLGIIGISVSDLNSELYELPIGIYIKSVATGSSADLAGIKAGDILVQFEGVTLKDMQQLKSLIAEKRVGDKVEVKLIRGKDKKTLQVELHEMPAISTNN